MAQATCCSCKYLPNQHQPTNIDRFTQIRITVKRRFLLSSTASCLLAVASTDQVPDSRTALLQKYLKKSEENKAKNDKQRMEDYYRRNYKDYFGFVEGTLQAKDKEQLSDSERGILEWLQKNK